MNEAHQFAAALYETTPVDHWTLLWTLPDKRSHWFELSQGPDVIADAAEALAAETADVYVSVSVATERGRSYQRIASSNSAGIMGLWADIDIATPDIHKKWNLPPSEEAARELLTTVGLEPTITVHSGHGLQAWWLFHEFWEFNDDEAHLEAATLAQAWNTTLRVRAAERGWVVDSTFDLARVMRMPGTLNHKGETAPVSILEIDPDRRYARDDFDNYTVDDRLLRQLGLTPVREYQVGELRLAPTANPPFDRFEALRLNDRRFAQTWERNRKDLTDQSPSSYDLALASAAVSAQWDDQEIVDLLIAGRRHHGDDLKLRLDYYTRTLAKAHDSIARDEAVESIEETVEEFREAQRGGDEEVVRGKRRAALDSVSQQLGIEVIRVLRFVSTPPSYRLETPTGGISLRDAQAIIAWNTMRGEIAATTGKLIDRFRPQAWDRLVQVIFECAEDIEIGVESTESGQVLSWLGEYLLSREPTTDVAAAQLTEYPYRDKGSIMVFGSALKRWLYASHGEHITQRELGRRLRLCDCLPEQIVLDVEEARSTRSVWRLPHGVGVRTPPKPADPATERFPE